MDNNTRPPRNIGLDLLRVTEATSVSAGRWVGSGQRDKAHVAAMTAMHDALSTVEMDGVIVIGEEGRMGINRRSPLDSGERVGTGRGTAVDVVVDPIDGTNLLIRGHPGALSLVGVAPRGAMWSPFPAVYLEKIVVDEEAAESLVPECMDAPAAWTLALVARVKGKSVRDLTVKVLDRPRHRDLIEEIRAAGARIILGEEGDAEGALLAAMPGTDVDILIGIGGASEGVIAACAVKALNGAMLARLAPQSGEERAAIAAAGLDAQHIWTVEEMINGNEVFFAATGITRSALLNGVNYHQEMVETHSLLLRSATHTRRFVRATFMAESINRDD